MARSAGRLARRVPVPPTDDDVGRLTSDEIGQVGLTFLPRTLPDALDALEYANGPVDSVWGSLRAKNGHPEPFNLRILEIGNENGGEFPLEHSGATGTHVYYTQMTDQGAFDSDH